MNYSLIISFLVIIYSILVNQNPLIVNLDSKTLRISVRYLLIILSIFESDKKWLEKILKIIIILLED